MEIESLYYYNKTSAGHLENIARNVYRERVTLLFTGNVPRGVFCEQSSQKTRELSLRSKRYFLCLSQEGSSFCASRSVLLVTE